MQLPNGSEERVLLSRTTTRHYADGRREIVPEEPVPPPQLSLPWERPGYRWVGLGADTEVIASVQHGRSVLEVSPMPPEMRELMDGDHFGIRIFYPEGGSKCIPLVRWCPIEGRWECDRPPGWPTPWRVDDNPPPSLMQLPPQEPGDDRFRRDWQRYGWLV